ncbi:hypothetical protein F4804DRAFT_317778 [Jackrogersella minutella]|nr:hypothetical protein F4804DRAFT_317778 [Jackrogersella minutella]
MASAADIITYVGVPLTVLGVLPILYNIVKTSIAYSNVKNRLKLTKNQDEEIDIRRDYFGGDVKVKLPKFRIAPLDREDSRYWVVSRDNMLPGGSWEIFNWNRLPSGTSNQRVRSANQLRQPQAEVNFEELITYLLDLGTTAHIQGWKSLRFSRIWTPKETCLMETSDKKPVLKVAPLDTLDLNGRLSLEVQLLPSQIMNNKSSQAQGWIRLTPEDTRVKILREAEHRNAQKPGQPDLQPPPPQIQLITDGMTDIQYTVDAKGLISVEPPDANAQHMRLRRGNPTAVWVSSALTAYAASQDVLMAYRIPESILDFSHSYSVPCGVLVLLGITNGSDFPHWEKGWGGQHEANATTQGKKWQPPTSSAAQVPLTKGQVDKMIQERKSRKFTYYLKYSISQNVGGDSRRLKQDEHDARIAQALQSKSWEVSVVSQQCLQWLNVQTSQTCTLEETIAALIHRMIQDEQLTASLGTILNLWKSWSENGGLRRSDYHTLQQSVEIFAYSALLLASIRSFDESPMADMQKCFDEWKDVRLG